VSGPQVIEDGRAGTAEVRTKRISILHHLRLMWKECRLRWKNSKLRVVALPQGTRFSPSAEARQNPATNPLDRARRAAVEYPDSKPILNEIMEVHIMPPRTIQMVVLRFTPFFFSIVQGDVLHMELISV